MADQEYLDSSRAPERATFILRLTRERRNGAAWRGEVEFIQLGERRPAGDAGTALSHVTEWLDAAGPARQGTQK
jgi:hypothetical protein